MSTGPAAVSPHGRGSVGALTISAPSHPRGVPCPSPQSPLPTIVGSRSGLPAACSASIPTRSAAGPTPAASRPGRPPAAIVASTGEASSGWPWTGAAPGRARLATLGATPERVNRAYRRRYQADAALARPIGDGAVDDADREAYRRDGRRLVTTLVAYLDATADDGSGASGGGSDARAVIEAEATAIVDEHGPPARRLGREPDRGGRAVRGGAPAVPRRAGRPRPAPIARSGASRRSCTRTPRRCSIGSCFASSPPTRREG